MFHFTMTMPLYLMMISGSILLLTALILRFLLKIGFRAISSPSCGEWC